MPKNLFNVPNNPDPFVKNTLLRTPFTTVTIFSAKLPSDIDSFKVFINEVINVVTLSIMVLARSTTDDKLIFPINFLIKSKTFPNEFNTFSTNVIFLTESSEFELLIEFQKSLNFSDASPIYPIILFNGSPNTSFII